MVLEILQSVKKNAIYTHTLNVQCTQNVNMNEEYACLVLYKVIFYTHNKG